MTPRTAVEAADYLRAREAQAKGARRLADHNRRLAQIEDRRAADLEADIARVRALIFVD